MPAQRLRCWVLIAFLLGCQRSDSEVAEVTPPTTSSQTVANSLTVQISEEPPPDPKAGTPVSWEGWTFHWSVRRREGLVLTNVAFRGRTVLKYAGLAEIFVPYNPGEPR